MALHKRLKTKEGKEFNFPRIFYNHLIEFKNKVENKFDVPVIITGQVGSGKSNFEIGIGGVWEDILWDRQYSLDHIHFSAENIVKETNREDNFTHKIGFDEAIQGGTSKDGMSRVGSLLRKALVSKRFKGHLLVFCVDSLKELNDKIIERSAIWYHVHYTRLPSGKYRKGLVKIFNIKQAMIIWKDLKDKKYLRTEEHPIWKKNKFVYNTNDYMGLWFTEQEYNKKKSKETDLLTEHEDKFKIHRNKLIMHCLSKGDKQKDIAQVIGLSRTAIAEIKSNMSSVTKV